MRNLMKLIAITAMTALLLFALTTCAAADEKIYTSPVFKLPPERLEKAEELIEAQEEEAEAEAPAAKKWVCSICGYVYEGEALPEDEAEEEEEPVMVRTTEQNIRLVEINRKNLVGTVLLAAAYLKEMKMTDEADLELARDLLEAGTKGDKAE